MYLRPLVEEAIDEAEDVEEFDGRGMLPRTSSKIKTILLLFNRDLHFDYLVVVVVAEGGADAILPFVTVVEWCW